MKLGLVDCSNDEYHSGDGVSKSHLDVVARSPLHYWQAYVNPDRPPREPTPAMVQGTAIHAAVLEPDLFATDFIAAPEDAPKRPTAAQRNAKKPSDSSLDAMAFWDDFNAQAEGKTVLTREQWTVADGCRSAVLRHKEARRLLAHGRAEESYFAIDPDTGVLVKCRTDWRSANTIVDVKSTEDASPDAFMRSILTYRYHVQQPWYLDVMDAAMDFGQQLDWVFLAIEKSAPYAIGLWTLPPEMVAAGRVEARRCLQAIVDCRMLDVWPDYASTGIVELQTPGWMRKRLGVDTPEADFD